MWVVVVDNDRRTAFNLVEEDLHVAVCGSEYVSPQTRGSLYCNDDPGHAFTGWAAVQAHSRVIVALADTGIPQIAPDPSLTAIAAVSQQPLFQDVMSYG